MWTLRGINGQSGWVRFVRYGITAPMSALLLAAPFVLAPAHGDARAREQPSAACLAAPDQVCLLLWAKDEAQAALSSNPSQGVNQATTIIEQLSGLGRNVDAFELLNAIPNLGIRYTELGILRDGHPSIGNVPEFRAAVQSGLQLLTGSLLSDDQSNLYEWPSLVRLADDINMDEEARSAYQQAVQGVRSGSVDKYSHADQIVTEVMTIALRFKDIATARELLGHLKSDNWIKGAQKQIADAETQFAKQPTEQTKPKAAQQRPAQPPMSFDVPLSRSALGAALQAASFPTQYVNLALQAAMAQDTETATAALAKLEGLPPGKMGPPVVALSCEFKLGFVHVLLADKFDLAWLIKDAETKYDAMSHESFAALAQINILALKMLNGQDEAVQRDVAGADPIDRAGFLGAAAGVAFGITGNRAVPYLKDAVGLVSEFPDPYERLTVLEVITSSIGGHTIVLDGCR
jgi:hypothetical protein